MCVWDEPVPQNSKNSKTYIKNVLNNAPCWNFIFHSILAILAQLINALRRVTLLAHILEIAFNFEVFRNTTIFLYSVWIHSSTRKLIYIILDEGSIECKSANHLAFWWTTALMHQSEIDITTEKRIIINIDYYFLKSYSFCLGLTELFRCILVFLKISTIFVCPDQVKVLAAEYLYVRGATLAWNLRNRSDNYFF